MHLIKIETARKTKGRNLNKKINILIIQIVYNSNRNNIKPNAITIGLAAGVRDISRVEIILQTTITDVRPVIKSKDGCFSNLNPDHCKNPSPSNIPLPVPTANGE
ncbi:hypothetical protein MKZ02_23700 [Pseudobacillus sp. FSL P4-0506]|uniref:hypothetical protein n=1 Tax=unclassified Pseudobacillus TaxID=2619284 RepID=UPI0030F54342